MFNITKSFKKMTKLNCIGHKQHFSMQVFNKSVKLTQRNAAALRPDVEDFEYVKSEFADRLFDRLSFINQQFPNVLEIGSGNGALSELIASRYVKNIDNPFKYTKPSLTMETVQNLEKGENHLSNLPPSEQKVTQEELNYAFDAVDRYTIHGMKTYTVIDSSLQHVENTSDKVNALLSFLPQEKAFTFNTIQGDLETTSFGSPESFDLILSNMSLHWENDLPTIFNKAMKALKPNGAFIGSIVGGESLRELRSALTIAGLERRGGVAQHVSPLTRPKDVGDLLSAAGFEMISVNMDNAVIHYPDMFTLCDHIQRMGEQNSPVVLSNVPRDIFLAASAAYDALYTDPENGMLMANLDVIFFIGWKHHESMHKASPRGSATAKIGENVNIEEMLADSTIKTTSVDTKKQ